MTEVTSKTAYLEVPQLGGTVAVIKYTKANAGDTVDASISTSIKTVDFALATLDTGAADPVTFSGSTVTLSTGTGAGRVIVVGR